MNYKSKKTVSCLLTLVLASSQLLMPVFATGSENTSSLSNTDFYYEEKLSYNEYLSLPAGYSPAVETISIDSKEYTEGSSSELIEDTADTVDGIRISENQCAVYQFNVEGNAYYNIELDYYPVEESTSAIKLEMLIDNDVPFSEFSAVSLKRVWQDNTVLQYDSQGNQIRLPSKQKPGWITYRLTDINGYSQEPFRIYLSEGSHTLSLNVYQSSMILSAIRLSLPEELSDYSSVLAGYELSGCYEANKTGERVEGESASAKSDRSIVLANDRSSTETLPYHSYFVRYNTIGGSSWKTVGEWVEWDVNAPEDGLYTIEMRWKQSLKINDVSSRALYIDGEIPFKEARQLSFSYDNDWIRSLIGNEQGSYLFYLTKGNHKIRLEANLGEYSQIISTVSDLLTELNEIYTDIVMITGPRPDVDRDYQFEIIIPEVIERIGVISDKLKQVEIMLNDFTGGGQSTALIKRMYDQLDRMFDDPDTISKHLKNLSSNITSLGTWINSSREQPLEIDYLRLSNTKSDFLSKKENIFKTIKHYAIQFLSSFSMDYANVGNMEQSVDEYITVWSGSGRDQADILRQSVNEDFIPVYGIGVNVQLVNAGALLPATLAGIGPDVYIGITEEKPVDYALRNAVVNLSEFDDIETVLERFYENSLTSFMLDGNLYALPETMTYPMLFYRKDILTKLGIKREDLLTWDSLLQRVLPELDMNYFNFGIPSTLKTFTAFLYQNSGILYNESNTASELDNQQAIQAFQNMTTIFTDYGVPKSYDFANRFRSGQMPLAIAEYSTYNQLSVFAPEIDGMWGILPIPGTEDENGNINNTAVCTVTGSVIFSNSDKIDKAWEFVKWWTSDDVQSRYGADLETVMGTGARYAAANINAMNSIEWEYGIKKSLNDQLYSVLGMPHIAGGYYTTRHFDFAFRDVVYNGANLRETIADAAENITNEISDKRKEFYGE